MKTYPEVCLERAEKATPGPWQCSHIGSIHGPDGFAIMTGGKDCENDIGYLNAEFIAHSRTDVEELAKRLKRASGKIRHAANLISRKITPSSEALIELAEELEALPKE